ncbi:hypothetical protein BJF92_11155 [Rhizobium rhizosphaerae]|uniref:Uncharacterized protein n=1 Tax=Xaviernesmea rhizosphaerae TaxID=1672749 RepID=A0A1Q9AMM3_9HYPH|nr:hypothetical protein [Xaviernesmea rhizosphaerae]OLP56641.1 hypothetical protein BJF92_11155 [Xaviernesmea rhizosphaerae]
MDNPVPTSQVDYGDIERLYRAVAEERPHAELLHQLYDLFGTDFDLRPPDHERRLVGTINGAKPWRL